MLSARRTIDGHRCKPQQGQSQLPRLSSDVVRISRSRSRDVTARNNLEVKALEAAVQTINKIMTSHQKRSQQQAQQSDTTEAGGKPAPRGKAKTFSCKAKANTKREITEPEDPDRAVHKYLSLPVEQYNLLDPRFITKDEDGSFVLRVPLQDVLGIDLKPQINITVDIDSEKGQVVFTADKFTINDPRLDKAFNISMEAVLTSKPHKQQRSKKPDAITSTSSSTSSSSGATATTSTTSTSDSSDSSTPETSSSSTTTTTTTTTNSSSSSSSSSSASEQLALVSSPIVNTSSAPSTQAQQQEQDVPHTHSLTCHVDVAFTVTVPPPLSIVPGFLLSSTGSLIAKLTMQALLPQFLELLAVDYARWSRGEGSRALPAGSLVPVTAAIASAAGEQEQQEQQDGPAGDETAGAAASQAAGAVVVGGGAAAGAATAAAAAAAAGNPAATGVST